MFLLKVCVLRTNFIKFYNFLLVFGVCISSNAADYKPQQLDEEKSI